MYVKSNRVNKYKPRPAQRRSLYWPSACWVDLKIFEFRQRISYYKVCNISSERRADKNRLVFLVFIFWTDICFDSLSLSSTKQSMGLQKRGLWVKALSNLMGSNFTIILQKCFQITGGIVIYWTTFSYLFLGRCTKCSRDQTNFINNRKQRH